MLKKLLHQSHQVGSLVNTNVGVFRVAAHGQKYDSLQGGKGIVEMTLERVSNQPNMTQGELKELNTRLKNRGALTLR